MSLWDWLATKLWRPKAKFRVGDLVCLPDLDKSTGVVRELDWEDGKWYYWVGHFGWYPEEFLKPTPIVGEVGPFGPRRGVDAKGGTTNAGTES